MIYLLPHSVLNAAERFPDREAFKCGSQSLTHSQMAKRMNQLASLLIRLGLKKGDRVGIYLHRSLETAIALYGIMRAGGIYVPLDPKAPASRNRFLLKDCGIEILISHPSQRRSLAKVTEEASGLKTIIGLTEHLSALCISWDEVAQQSSDFSPPFRILEQDLAYFIYTSGSTGTPKGIMHTHYSGLTYARLTADLYKITTEDRIGNHAPIHFDISTLGYFTAPYVGASTVIASDAHTVMPASLSQLIANEQVSIWYSVPLALVQMLQNGLLDQRDMSRLRWVFYAGEPFTPKYLRALMQLWPHARFSNIYGPAEVNQCTFYNLPAPPEGDDPIPIGEVWGNSEGLIVDENDDEVPTGVPGELLIRSGTMMQGYWRKPELTERSWYRREINPGFEEKFYRTGDLVQRDEAGVLHFLGRKDHQVKVRGYRVELGEIETQLAAHNAVGEVAVVARKDEEGINHLEAAIIRQALTQCSEEELRNFLKQQLPFYAIPERLVFVDDFPRTSSGKINRGAIKTILQSTNT